VAHLKVFLSHLTVEARLADILRQHVLDDFLGMVDMFVSTDITSIPAGSQWLEKLIRALQSSEMHLVLCSPESVVRPWIQYEAGAAGVRRTQTVPLCHSGLLPHQLPVPISEAQAVQLSTAAGWQALYAALAARLQCRVPAVDFGAYVEEVRDFERDYVIQNEQSDALTDGGADDALISGALNVTCATSSQFLDLGFQNQIELVQSAFPEGVHHRVVVGSAELRTLLATETVDILHVATYVCPRTGDLYFTDVDPGTGASRLEEPDVLSADALAELLRRANTRLVVVGSCESLVLAATLLSVTNVIATRDMVSPKMMARWIEVFYGALDEKRVKDAFEQAVAASGARMRFFPRAVVDAADGYADRGMRDAARESRQSAGA
jgi:hypothetical protein